MVCLERWLPVVLAGMALVAVASPVWARTPAEIEAIAKASTVKIEFGKNNTGTGVIVYRQGQVYSLITNRHVVCGESLCSQLLKDSQYRLSLPDGQQMQVNAENIQLLGQDLDLAVIQFTSKRSYPLAKVATSSHLKVEDNVFTAGFPTSQRFTFGQGKAVAVLNRRISDDSGGYSVIYDAFTLPGMSGGGVFNSDGNLVAIHGLGDKYKSGTDVVDDSRVDSKIGYNRGIPIRWLVQSLGETGITVGVDILSSATQAASSLSLEVADEHFIIGFNKFVNPGADVIAGKREAIQQFTKAIQLNPNYGYAYFARAYTYNQVDEFQKSLSDYDQVIALNPKNVNAYVNRGSLKYQKLNNFQSALVDFDNAIALNPKNVNAYVNRGSLKYQKLNNFQGALADFNEAIILDPKNANAYANRGNLNYQKLNKPQDALVDFDRAIDIDPKNANAYVNRGNLKYEKLNKPQDALVDFNKAIDIDPNNASAHVNRGNLKHQKLDNFQGARVDFDKAIALDPKNADAFYNRGDFFYMIDRTDEALQDFRKASELGALSWAGLMATGIIASEQDQFTSAIDSFNQALSAQPQFGDGFKYRGLAYRRQGQTSQAIQDWQKTTQLYKAANYTRDYQIVQGWLKKLGVVIVN